MIFLNTCVCVCVFKNKEKYIKEMFKKNTIVNKNYFYKLIKRFYLMFETFFAYETIHNVICTYIHIFCSVL